MKTFLSALVLSAVSVRSLRHIKEGFLKPNVYAPKGTTLKLPDNESLCCTPRPDRG